MMEQWEHQLEAGCHWEEGECQDEEHVSLSPPILSTTLVKLHTPKERSVPILMLPLSDWRESGLPYFPHLQNRADMLT